MKSSWRVAVVLACLLAAFYPVARADRAEETPLRASFSLFPMEFDGWSGVQLPPFSDAVLAVLGLDDYLTRNYVSSGRRIANLYVGYWKSQRQGDTIHSPQNCLPGSGWEPVSQSRVTFADPRDDGGGTVTVNRYLIRKGLQQQLVLYWYQSRGRVVAGEYESRFRLILDAARYNRTDAALVRIVVPVENGAAGEAEAERTALSFATALLVRLGDFLPD